MGATTQAARRRRVDAPEYRPYPVRVVRTNRLGTHFVRVTFGGRDLAGFGYAGHDQRVKILLAQSGRTLDEDLPRGVDWYRRLRALPDRVRPSMRTYTVRAFRPWDAELDVDFVLHGLDRDQPGPLSSWAARARPGDEVALLGPDRPGSGRRWGVEWAPPTGTRQALVAADETAVPAVGAILDDFPADLPAVVLAEVPGHDDIASWCAPAGVEVRWLVRAGPHRDAPRGVLLEQAMRDALSAGCGVDLDHGDDADTDAEGEGPVLWDVPELLAPGPEGLYVWMAGEAGVMKRLRELARRDCALPRNAVVCMGYWRQGSPEPL